MPDGVFILFAHILFGVVAFVLVALYVAARGRPTRGVLGVVLYSAVCLGIGLAINPYL